VDRISLSNLSPAAVDPRDLVNREADADWLCGGLTAWMRSADPSVGGAFCVLGDKGIGKSILTRRVIEDLREVHAATTLFLLVDCRPLRNQRDVYREAATQLVEELVTRQREVPAALIGEARAFDTLTRFDQVTLRHAHEQLIQYKVGLDIGGSQSLVKWLDAKLGISLARTSKNIQELEGSITVDGPRLYEGFVQLLYDIARHSSLRVVLYLDNIEELRHEALSKDEAREAVRADVEALLHLAEAPLGLVLNMRTYYSSVLTRRISKRRTLGPMSAGEQAAIFERRLLGEDSRDQARVRESEAVAAAVEKLSALASTPLAFLTWTEFILDEGIYDEQDIAGALVRRLSSHYSTIAREIPKIAALFDDPGALVPAEAVREACAGNDSIYRQLIEQQVLLPHNYWDPREFSLDPELGFLIGRPDLAVG
jgi:hypothetical protein